MTYRESNFWHTKLIFDVRFGSVDDARKTLNSMKDGNFAIKGMSPLIAAVEKDSPVMCTMLVQSGKCDPNVRFKDMEYPLIHGLQREKNRSVETLLQLGANPRCRSMKGIPASFYSCMKTAQSSIYNLLRQLSPDAFLDLSGNRESCLLVAARYGNRKVVSDLCDLKSKGVKMTGSQRSDDGIDERRPERISIPL